MIRLLFRKSKDKLRSRQGISITIGLLLFLVCAVVGSVVLTSATAASGRVKGLTESDRRYYAVTSAAELFRDALADQEVTVHRYVRQPYTVTWEKNAVPGDPEENGDPTYPDPDLGKDAEGDPILPAVPSLLTEATLDYVLGLNRESVTNNQTLYEHVPGADWYPAAAADYATLLITAEETGLTPVQAAVKIKSGMLVFTFTNVTDIPSERFSLSFTLSPGYDPKSTQSTVGRDKTTVKHIPATDTEPEQWLYTKESTIETDESLLVTWQASSIRKGASE